jgi:hypothetical protein
MLTLPSDFSTNKDNVSVGTILLIDFTGKSYYIASRTYTASGQAYNSLLKKNSSLGIGVSLPQLLNDLSSISAPTLYLLDWQGTLRGNMVGTTPDLTNSAVDIYVKLDTASTNKADAVKVFSGVVAEWEVSRDVMMIKLKNLFIYQNIPPNTLKIFNVNTIASDNICRPIQIGDFNWTYDPRYYKYITNAYATCPLETASDNGTFIWFASDHIMNEIPTDDNLEDNIGDAYAFVVRDKKYINVKFDSNTVTVDSARSYVFITTLPGDHLCSLFGKLTSAGSTNNMDDWANAVNGDSASSVNLSSVGDILNVSGADYINLTENIPQNDGTDSDPEYNPIIHVKYGDVSGIAAGFPATISWRKDSNNSWSNGIPIPASTPPANSWQTYQTDLALDSWDDFPSVEIKIEYIDDAHELVEVQQIIIEMPVQTLSSSDKYLYLRCKGIEYSGTWEGRKTSGNLITNLADTIEMFLRDYQGITDIDTDSFDKINTAFTDIEANGSFYIQRSGDRFLKNLCSACNVSLILSSIKKWRLVMAYPGANKFSSSGTDTPGNEDIFTDTVILSSGAYDKHPIQEKSFRLQRTSSKDIYEILQVDYHRTHQGYIKSFSESSSGKTKIIENFLISSQVSATIFRDIWDSWYLNQKMIARFSTFLNAMAHEAGDIINIRHSDLNDDILNETETTQKWMISEIGQGWRPNVIEIEAIELFDEILKPAVVENINILESINLFLLSINVNENVTVSEFTDPDIGPPA